MPDGPFHTVTNSEVWHTLKSLERTASELQAGVDKLNMKFDNASEDRDEDRKRIRALEMKFYGVVAGILGAIGLIASGMI